MDNASDGSEDSKFESWHAHYYILLCIIRLILLYVLYCYDFVEKDFKCSKCVLLLIKMDGSLEELVDLIQKSPPDLQEAFKHACASVLQNKVEVDVRFKHPINMVLAGPSQSGKSWFVKEMLTHKQITPYPSHVVLAYKEWQPLYDDMKEQGLVQSFV